MSRKICFIGHRRIPKNLIKERLEKVILDKINLGYRNFIVGSHGEFDYLVLNTLRNFRDTYKDINIELVTTSISKAIKSNEESTLPSDVKNIVYDIEETHYKKKITVSNQKMIDESELLIAYVDETRYQSGAKLAYKYAQKQNIQVINIYKPEDEPTFGMTKEEKERYWEKITEEIRNFGK